MTSACRPSTAWRRLAILAYAASLAAPAPGAETCGTCARTSLGLAPRSYPAGDAPVAAAAGDLDGDGRADLVVANNPPTAGKIRVLLGGPLGFAVAGTYDQLVPVPRGVAIADFDTDGLPDVAVAAGEAGSGEVSIFRNLGGGTLSAAPVVSRTAGNNTSAVVVGDFDGNGTQDVAAAAEDSNQVLVFLGDGKGGLDTGHVTSVGNQPRALVAGRFDADAILDLAVACAGDDRVRVLKGNGDGTFTAGPILTVGDEPVGLAGADLEPDGDLDLVSANHSAGTVSILTNDGTGVFTPAGVSPVVGGTPTGVAVLQVAGTSRLDIVTASGPNTWVDLLLDDGAGGYQAATHPSVLLGPQSVVPVDADADGRLDLAVPCRTSDAVAVLLARPPGPPPLAAAVRYAVGSQPAAAAAVDLDGDLDVDLAVANEGASTVSILLNNGSGVFSAFGGPRTVRSGPRAIVAGDFDRDGIQDLAVSSNVTNEVSVLRGTGSGNFAAVAGVGAGPGPDGLAAADVDGDLDLDLLVCNRVSSGTVTFLRNTSTVGAISFVLADTFAVGPDPTSIFVGRLDGNATLDFAVANYTAARLTVLHGNGAGDFADLTPEILPLAAGDVAPTSVLGADFDGDGDADLAATVLTGSAVSIFRNDGTSFFQPPSRIPAMDLAVHAAAADVNHDGKLDLAVATTGFEVLRGRGSVTTFEAGEDFVAGGSPVHVIVEDFSRDGLRDVAVVNRGTNDVSIVLGTRCAARRLVLTQQPAEAACLTGLGPFNLQAVVEARDDGGNLACPAGEQVEAAIVAGTGTAGALLTGTVNSPPSVPLTSGIASFTGTTDSLTLDKAGRRYQLQFSLPTLPAVPPAVSHTFTLGAQPVILGPASFCPGSQATYAANPVEGDYDEYRWTLDGGASPFAFAPSIVLKEPPTLALGSHVLSLQTRVDSCVLSAPDRTLWYAAWLGTTLSAQGPTTVCVDCLGGTVKPTDQGGGAVASRQWGYRTTPGGTITPIAGETGETYFVKGTDFPAPTTYYLVVTTRFTCPSTGSVSAELPILVTDQVATSEVQFLAVTSRGSGASGENLLQWVSSSGSPDEICVTWNKAPDGTSACTFPVAPSCPSADGPTWHRMLNPPADTRGWSHASVSVGTAYCYAVFVYESTNVPQWSPGRVVKARAFNSDPGPVKWAYSTGATAVAPPVIGKYGILAMSNDRTVHEITRGSTGGAWPASWVPRSLTGVAHQRSPVIPFAAGVFASADAVLFVGDDQGDVHAVDTKTGQAAWRATPLAGATITGAPGAILQQYGAVRDLVLAGTRRDPLLYSSGLFGLNLVTGTSEGSFDAAGTLGPISGSPAVDYSSTPQRVYFASRRRGAGDTVWAVNVNPGATPFTTAWSAYLGDFDTSPVLRGTRVYVANNASLVYSLDAGSGGDSRSMNTLDGPVKGFLFPDRRNDDLIFATNTTVRSVSDTATGFVPKWTWTIPSGSPSVVLYWPQTNYVYVGGGNGRLYELDFTYADPGTPPTHKEVVLGDGTGQIGAPSLDIGVNPRLLVVGSESGVLYGVEVPLP